MKLGKGPDGIPVEVWKSLGEEGVDMLLDLLQKIFEQEKMPEELRDSVIVPIYKDKDPGFWELQRHQDDISYHEDLGNNNRQNTEGGDKHRRRAVRFHDGQRDNRCHICSEAGDRETPGNAEGTAHGVY